MVLVIGGDLGRKNHNCRKRQLHAAVESVIAVFPRFTVAVVLGYVSLLVPRDCELSIEIDDRTARHHGLSVRLDGNGKGLVTQAAYEAVVVFPPLPNTGSSVTVLL
jgi:hypothetical protein